MNIDDIFRYLSERKITVEKDLESNIKVNRPIYLQLGQLLELDDLRNFILSKKEILI